MKKEKIDRDVCHLWSEIFRANVYVVEGPKDADEVEGFLRAKGFEYVPRGGSFAGRAITLDDGMNVWIFLARGLDEPEKIASLSHEAFHAAHMILSLRGQENRCGDGEECHAYMLGWIVRGYLEWVLTKKPKKRKR